MQTVLNIEVSSLLWKQQKTFGCVTTKVPLIVQYMEGTWIGFVYIDEQTHKHVYVHTYTHTGISAEIMIDAD